MNTNHLEERRSKWRWVGQVPRLKDNRWTNELTRMTKWRTVKEKWFKDDMTAHMAQYGLA